MDAVRLGTVVRALRIKKRWRQVDLAQRAGVSRSGVSNIETGRIDRARVEDVLAALGGRIDFVVSWRGGDLDRLLNARHSAMHELVAGYLRRFRDWQIAPEVSFNIRGERGVIDILAWHAATGTLLEIELKTEIVDINELMGTLDRKARLAVDIARGRGWFAAKVAVWLVVGDSAMNRRRVGAHSTTLKAALPSDGRSVESWLSHPHDEFRCLSFWANSTASSTKRYLATVKRVRSSTGSAN